MNRRQAIAGIAAVALAGGTVGAALYRRAAARRREEAAMQADFAAGRILVADGWFVSEHEVELLGLEDATPFQGAP